LLSDAAGAQYPASVRSFHCRFFPGLRKGFFSGRFAYIQVFQFNFEPVPQIFGNGDFTFASGTIKNNLPRSKAADFLPLRASAPSADPDCCIEIGMEPGGLLK
jgi:hypothetical protein